MTETISFYVFNIKLQSNKTGAIRTETYTRLIENLTKAPYTPFPVGKNEAIVFYSSTKSTYETGKPYLYGRASKGLYISGEKRNVLKDGKIDLEDNNPNQIINPTVNRYLFVPDAHRLFLEKKNGAASQSDVEKYLNEELRKFIDSDELLEVILEKDKTTIKQVFDAKIVHSISYSVSYSNEDFLDDLADVFDKELKDSNIGALSVVAKADNKSEGLKIDQSNLLGGGLKLAETNGELRNATITPPDSKKQKILTNKNLPKVLTMKYKEGDNFWDRWIKNVVAVYRPTK